MSMPFYVSPEQLMKDRADFARKGIARGRSVVAVQYADGILFASENPSQALHKVSEIYDRIAFAAVGRYNEFENLRIAGVRLADMRGYAYDRRDVTGRGLANAYAQTLGTIFSSGGEKPYEVEIFVAEIGDRADRRPDLPADLPGSGHRRAPVRRDGRRRRGRRVVPRRSTTPRARPSPTPSTWPSRRSGAGPEENGGAAQRPCHPGRVTSRWRCSTAPGPSRRKFLPAHARPAGVSARRSRARRPPRRPRGVPGPVGPEAQGDGSPEGGSQGSGVAVWDQTAQHGWFSRVVWDQTASTARTAAKHRPQPGSRTARYRALPSPWWHETDDEPIRGEVRGRDSVGVSHGLFLVERSALRTEEFHRTSGVAGGASATDAVFTHVTAAQLLGGDFRTCPAGPGVRSRSRRGEASPAGGADLLAAGAAERSSDAAVERGSARRPARGDPPARGTRSRAPRPGRHDRLRPGAGDLDPDRMARVLASRRPGTTTRWPRRTPPPTREPSRRRDAPAPLPSGHGDRGRSHRRPYDDGSGDVCRDEPT